MLPRRTIDSFKFGYSNFGRTIFDWVGPVLASKTSPAGPNYVDQTWSGRTDFSPDQFFRYSAQRSEISFHSIPSPKHSSNTELDLAISFYALVHNLKALYVYSVSDVHWELHIVDSSLFSAESLPFASLPRDYKLAPEFAYWRPTAKLILTRTI